MIFRLRICHHRRLLLLRLHPRCLKISAFVERSSWGIFRGCRTSRRGNRRCSRTEQARCSSWLIHCCNKHQKQEDNAGAVGSLHKGQTDTVNPEYFVRTTFSYVGDLRPFVRMEFPYSRWPLRTLWLAMNCLYAFYFRTEAAAYEINENKMHTKYSGYTPHNMDRWIDPLRINRLKAEAKDLSRNKPSIKPEAAGRGFYARFISR